MHAVLIICNTTNRETLILKKQGDACILMTPDGYVHSLSYQAMQQTPDDPLFVDCPDYSRIVKRIREEDGMIRYIDANGVYFGLPTAHQLSYSQQRFLRS